MWKNETNCGIHATRFIASWCRMGGTLISGEDYDNFREWLETAKVDGDNLTEEDVNHIVYLAQNGKLELETSAKMFIAHKRL